MNKAQLVAEVQKSLGADTSKAAAGRSIDAVEDIKETLKDKNVQLLWYLNGKRARDGINPQTQENPYQGIQGSEIQSRCWPQGSSLENFLNHFLPLSKI